MLPPDNSEQLRALSHIERAIATKPALHSTYVVFPEQGVQPLLILRRQDPALRCLEGTHQLNDWIMLRSIIVGDGGSNTIVHSLFRAALYGTTVPAFQLAPNG